MQKILEENAISDSLSQWAVDRRAEGGRRAVGAEDSRRKRQPTFDNGSDCWNVGAALISCAAESTAQKVQVGADPATMAIQWRSNGGRLL